MTTKDEALRVAREALENILGVEVMAPEGGREEVTEIHGIARSALRTIALAVEAPSEALEWTPLPESADERVGFDRGTQLHGDVRLNIAHVLKMFAVAQPGGSYADLCRIMANEVVKFSPAVQSVALGDGWGELRKDFDFDLASASGAVGEAAGTNASQLIDELEWAVLARSQGVPGSADRLHDAKQAIRDALAGVPATSNDQQEKQ